MIYKKYKCSIKCCKSHLISKQLNVNLFILKSIIKEIPNSFNLFFIVFDNTEGNNDVILTDKLTFRNKKCADFYLEEGTKNKYSLTKTIKSGDWDVFIHMPYSYSSVSLILYKVHINQVQKEKIIKKRRTKKKRT